MSNLSKREIGLLVVLLIAVCIAIYYNFVLKPYFADSEALRIETNDCRSAINDAKLKKASILKIDQDMKAIQTDMDQKLSNVLDSIDRPAMIVLLSKTLLPYVTSSTITFSPVYQELGSNYITTIEASFQCTNEGFIRILSNLRTAKPITRVVTSSIKLFDGTNGNCDAKIMIEIITSSIIPTNIEFTYK